MLDQSFTVANFRKIFDYENRKGCYLEGRYFPNIETITRNLKTCAGDFKRLKKSNLSPNEYESRKAQLNENKEELKQQKENILISELEKITEKINEDGFFINLTEVHAPMGKPVYSIDVSDACAYFIVKQIQYNIKTLYKVEQSSRYKIICQLKGVLNNNFPKYIIRTDIKDFYESIPRDRLLEKINQDGYLTLSSRKYIKDILSEYGKISGSTIGIPRGIGISAYLAELYMRDFDDAVRTHHEIIFYARYVDDIIIVYAPKPNSNASTLLEDIKSTANKLILTLNETKTKIIDVIDGHTGKFEYLGYVYSLNNGSIELKISKNKEKRYKNRIKIIFEAYNKDKNETKARKLLIKRLRFLTGNTRLSNNKDNALIGVYFSNSLITNSSCLSGLDHLLKNYTSKLSSQTLKTRIGKMTFEDGWNQRTFYQFTPKNMQEIVKVWKNGA